MSDDFERYVKETSDFCIDDLGRRLTVNWRRDVRRTVEVAAYFMTPDGQRLAPANPDATRVVVLEPGEVLVIRAAEPRPMRPLTVDVDGGFTVG